MTTYILSLTILAAAVLLVRALFRKSVSSKVIYAMWLAVVLRMCLPFDIILLDMPQRDLLGLAPAVTAYEESAEPVESVPADKVPSLDENGQNTVQGGAVLSPVPDVDPDTPSANTPSVITPAETNGNVAADSKEATADAEVGGAVVPEQNVQTNPLTPELDEPAQQTENVPSGEQTVVPALQNKYDGITISASVKKILLTVWIAGSAVTFAAFGISWLVFNGRLRRSRKLYGHAGSTRIYVSDAITSPCVAGIIPKIYITPDAAESEQLPVILLHEKTHISHGDHFWSLVRVAAVSAHWWNPVVWLSAVLSKRDAELACDESVAKRLDSRERIEYARLIVDMTPVRKNYALSFAGSPIKERVLKLTREHKNKIIAAAVAVILVIGCVTVAFIGAKEDGGESASTETTDVTESTGEEEPVPDNVYGLLKVLEATDENISAYESIKEYDVSASEYNFSLLLVPTEDIADLAINSLIWNEELLVCGEEVIETVGEVKAGEAVLLTTDSVEIIGYVGISYTMDGETVRYYPATSGMDGSAILVEIGRNLLSVELNQISPDQRHVGVWESGGINLAIYKVLDGEIAFRIEQYKGFDYRAVAVLKDGEYVFGHEISPYSDFWDYYANRDDSSISGRIIFGESEIKIEADGKFFFMEGLDCVFTKTRGTVGVGDNANGYSDWIGHPTAVYDMKDSIKELMVEKGWYDYERYDSYNIICYCGNPDGVKLWGIEIPVNDSEYKAPHYTVVGNYGSLSVAVKFSYDLDSDTCSVLDVYYADRFGNLLEDDELLSITKGKTGLDAVLGASGGEIVEYFDSKGRAEKLDGARFEVEENYTDSISPEKLAAMEAFAKENAVYPEVYPEFSNEDVYVYPPDRAPERFNTEYVPISGSGAYYRYNYYAEPTFLYPLVGYDAVKEWYNKVMLQLVAKYPEPEPEEMFTVSFVKYFEIPKEDFIKAQQEYREKILPILQADGIDINTENYEEIPADIIYTFDKSIINKYHWRVVSGTSEPYSTTVSSDHLAKAETDIRYKWITSFIGKDIDGCVEVLASNNWNSIDEEKSKEIMAPLEDMYFRYYTVTDIHDDDPNSFDRLLFEFYLDRSNCDEYPVGQYKAEVSTGTMFNFYVHFTERPGITKQTVLDKYEYELGFAEYLFDTAYNITFPDDPYSDDWGWQCMSENLVCTYMYVNDTQYGEDVKFTKAELLALAKELYGIESYELYESAFTETDGIYRVVGHGGVGMKMDIVGITDENGVFTVDVRYYTDIAEFGEAFVVRYTFERTDSVYGLRLLKIEKIKDNGYRNWGYVV